MDGRINKMYGDVKMCEWHLMVKMVEYPYGLHLISSPLSKDRAYNGVHWEKVTYAHPSPPLSFSGIKVIDPR